MAGESSKNRVLSSWKEIARTLGRGVRTVQRWEKLGLPVRRPSGAQNVVVADESEICEWFSAFESSRGSKSEAIEDMKTRLLRLSDQVKQIEKNIAFLTNRLPELRHQGEGQIQAAPSKLISVLAVDDNEIHRYALAKILENSGFKVRVAKDGEDALQQTSVSRPDVILLDVNLPGISGFTVCTSLRSDKRTKDIPVVFHTASSPDEASRNRAFSSGATEFLTYPVPRERLVEVINRCVSGTGANADPEQLN